MSRPPDKRVEALRSALVAFAVLAIAFMALSGIVAAGGLRSVDREVAATMSRIWVSPLLPLFQLIAVLGGIEVTSLVALALAAYIWRKGFHAEAGAVLALPAAVLLEELYKHLVPQPGPGPELAHPDGPSLSTLIERAGNMGSYPSGHMTRTVFVYGLLAFVVVRMAERRWIRLAAVPAAVLLCALMAFDRIYLNVHWESDVIGGVLLGALALAAAILWLDRPRGVV